RVVDARRPPPIRAFFWGKRLGHSRRHLPRTVVNFHSRRYSLPSTTHFSCAAYSDAAASGRCGMAHAVFHCVQVDAGFSGVDRYTGTSLPAPSRRENSTLVTFCCVVNVMVIG